jgi:ABC-type lipoprotein release transport system permease subunit
MRRRTMTIVGIYDVGVADIEKRTVYISLQEAQELYGLPGQATEVMVSLQRMGQEDEVVAAIQPQLPGYEIDTWKTAFPEMEQTIEMKNSVMDMFGVVILAIAGIGILNLLMMAVYERSREIGILGALGMKPRQITFLFLIEGALMGVVGVALGAALGVGMNFLLGRVGIDYSQFASITEYTALISGRIYPTLGLEKLLQRAIIAVVIAVLAAYYPAYEAAHKEPAKALHFV